VNRGLYLDEDQVERAPTSLKCADASRGAGPPDGPSTPVFTAAPPPGSRIKKKAAPGGAAKFREETPGRAAIPPEELLDIALQQYGIRIWPKQVLLCLWTDCFLTSNQPVSII